MRSLVVDSSRAVVAAVLQNLPATVRHFVDFGCGRGEVLAAVARRRPQTDCVGIDSDRRALSFAASRVVRENLSNVELVDGDVLDHVGLATDVAYLYLGGALNQRLGHHLLADDQPCTRIIAARYPIVAALPSTQWATDDDSQIFVYDKPRCRSLVEWDYRATELITPAGSSYLLSRAVRVQFEAELGICVTTRGGGATVVAFEFGQCPSRPGVPLVVDLLINVPAGPPTVLDVALTSNGQTLAPVHTVVARPADTAAGCPPQERTLNDVEFAGIGAGARR